MTRARLTAADIAHALGGRRVGKGFIARCPAHDDKTPSLSIADSADSADGRVLVHCHAGCSQQAVIAALSARGIWPRSYAGRTSQAAGVRRVNAVPREAEETNRERALDLWTQAHPAEGTLVETYLRSRGISIAPPPAIRFHERLWHAPSGRAWPGMVALITNALTGEPIGAHRTFLAEDGCGKAPIEPSRMMIGTVSGGVVRLADMTEDLLIGEGIETCLSVQQACELSAWAALSASGLKAVNLPPGITRLTILADGDPVGEAAAKVAAQRLRLTVRTVRVVRAPMGRDFNDILTANPPRRDK